MSQKKNKNQHFMKVFIVILVAVFSLQYFYNTKTIQVNEIKHDNVILYAASWCGYCQNLRQFFDDKNIQYVEYDIEKSDAARKEFQALGGKGVPVLDIKGTVILGYDMKNTKHVLKVLHLI
jgi:glutaredoxin